MQGRFLAEAVAIDPLLQLCPADHPGDRVGADVRRLLEDLPGRERLGPAGLGVGDGSVVVALARREIPKDFITDPGSKVSCTAALVVSRGNALAERLWTPLLLYPGAVAIASTAPVRGFITMPVAEWARNWRAVRLSTRSTYL